MEKAASLKKDQANKGNVVTSMLCKKSLKVPYVRVTLHKNMDNDGTPMMFSYAKTAMKEIEADYKRFTKS